MAKTTIRFLAAASLALLCASASADALQTEQQLLDAFAPFSEGLKATGKEVSVEINTDSIALASPVSMTTIGTEKCVLHIQVRGNSAFDLIQQRTRLASMSSIRLIILAHESAHCLQSQDMDEVDAEQDADVFALTYLSKYQPSTVNDAKKLFLELRSSSVTHPLSAAVANFKAPDTSACTTLSCLHTLSQSLLHTSH